MMALFTKTKPMPTLQRLKALAEAEATERRMREALRWVPLFREVLAAYDRSLESVKHAHALIYGPGASTTMRQMAGAYKRRVNVDCKGLVAPDRAWRLMAMSGPSDQYTTELHERGLTIADPYLCAVYEWARPGEGISESEAAAKAEAAAETCKRLTDELKTWDPSEVVMRDVTLSDGRKAQSPFFSFAPDILAGDVPTLLDWARQHPEAVT